MAGEGRHSFMSKQSKMTGADYLLLLLYLDNCSAINGAIRITKMMFLFNMEIAPVLKKKGVSICDEDLPKFSAYNYGPFSKDVYEQVELFQSIGFIKVKNLYATEEMSEVDDWEESAFETEFSEGSCQYSSNQDGKFMQYKLLNLGKKYVESEIIPQLTNDQLAVLTTYKQRIVHTSPKMILRYAQMDKIRYSIMRLFIYYFSKSVLEHDFAHKDYQAFFGYLKKHRTIEPPTIITTNWDTLIESYCNKYSVDYSYGFLQPYTSDSIKHAAKNYDLLLLKIHGSANWLRCLNCGSISIFEKNHAATSLFEDNRTEKCPVCGHEKTAHGASMQPELITPTMMKSLSNQLYTNLWSSAAQELRDATHIIFVGYSLPIADFEFRYMLQKNVTSSAKIDVILTPNSNPDLVANNLKDLLPSKRYLDAFPKNKVSFYYEGFGPYFSLSK